MKIADCIGKTLVVETENTRYVFDIMGDPFHIYGQSYPNPYSGSGRPPKYMKELTDDVEISGTKLADGPWDLVPKKVGEAVEGGFLRFRYRDHEDFISTSRITYVGVTETRSNPELVSMSENPYQSPVTEPAPGPFARGFKFGFGLIVAFLILALGVVSGILAFTVTTIIAGVKALFSKAVLTWAAETGIKAVVVWFLWPYVFVIGVTYFEAVAIVILTSILVSPKIFVKVEKTNGGLNDLLALSSLLGRGPAKRETSPGGPASNDSQCAGPSCGPQRPVSAASRR